MKKLKSLISVLLCAVLVLGMLPVHAHATVEDSQLVLYLHDACSDGWDGASIEMFDGTETHTFTVEYDDDVLPISYDPEWTDGTDAEYHIPFDPSLTYSFRWSSGNYDEECSFEIYLDGEELYSCEDASSLDDGEEFYLYVGCSHSSMSDGVCADCGGICGETFPHKVAGTACNLCGGVCGVDFAHKLVDGVCTACGDSVPMYLVTVEECANGSVAAYPSLAAVGELVQLAWNPEYGYTLENFTVIDDNGQEITVTDDQFRMPDTHVTVTATFTKRIGDFVVTGNDNWYVDDDGDLRLTDSGDYTISMKPGVESSDQTIFLSEMGMTANLTLDNVSCAQIKGDGITVNMTLVGENAFNGDPSGYGSLTKIQSLTVSGTGSLDVKNSFCGDLTVNSGSVTVSRYSDYCLEGNLTVNGGTVDVINTTGTDHIAVTGDVTVNDGIVNITTVAASAIGQNLIVEKGTVTVMGEPAVAGMVIPGGDLIETFLAGESAETAEPIDFNAGQMYQGEKYLKLTLVECQHEEIGENCACTACGRVCGIGFDHQPDENNVCLKCATALYKVTVQCGPFGTVELSPDLCVAGQIVRVRLTGKLLSMTITADNGEPVEVNPTYDFKMPASDVTVTARFAKAIRFVLEDSYGDGWTGNALVVVDEDGNTVETVTIATGENYEKEVTLDPCKRYTIQWEKGSYSDECSFLIQLNGALLMEVTGEDAYAFENEKVLQTIDGAHDPDATGTCANCGGICGQDFDHQPDETNTCTHCGAVCTVYSVTVNKPEGGTVTAPAGAYAGQTVRLQVSQGLKTITVTDANGEEVEISEDYTFVMPDSDVTVTATFYDLLEIQMKDLGHDGWNGNALVVIDEDGNTQTITFQAGGAHTEAVGVDPCKRYTIQWQAGNYSYECSFLIKLNGALLMEATEEDAEAFENEEVLLTLDVVHRLNATGTCTNCGAVFTVYPVTVAQTENGTVSASFAAAYEGRKIRLTVMPKENFALKSLTVTDEEGNEIPVTDNCFVMPASGVTVTAAFEKDSGDFVITGDSGWRVVDGDVDFYESGSYTVAMKEGITESDATFYFGEGAGGTFDITLVNVTTAIFWDAYGNCTVNLTLVGDNVIKGDQHNNHTYLKSLSVGGTGSLTIKTLFHANLTVNSGTVRFTGKTGYEYHGIGMDHPSYPSTSVVVNGGTLIANGGDGRNGEDVDDADGYNGGHAIFGDLIVNGGKVILTGGKGGKAHRYMEGGVDGTDGIAISGTVTIGQGAVLRTFVAGEDADTAAAVTAYNGEKYLKLDVLKENTVDMYSLSLTDHVDMNFYTYLSPEAAESAYMVFTIGNRTVTDTESKEVTINGVTYRVFSCPTYAKEMSLPVQAQLFWGDGQKSGIYSYSAKQYAQTQLADENASEELKQLLRDMLQYGAYAQKQFAFNADDLANDGITGAGSIDTVTALPKTLQREGSGSLTLKTLSLSLRETVSMNLYFEAAGDTAGITVKRGEEELALTLADNGLYSVRIHGIAAKDLDKPVTVTITEAGAEPYTITLTPLTYAAIVLESQQSESLVDLVKSMYLYHTSAAAYFASLNH